MPAAGFRNALQTLTAEIEASRSDGDVTLDEFERIMLAAVETLLPEVRLVRGDAEAVDALTQDAIAAANEAIERIPAGKFFQRQSARAVIAFGVPALVKVAADSAAPLERILDEQVLPYTRAAERVLHAFNAGASA